MPEKILGNFGGGLNDYFSASDIQDSEFQEMQNVSNLKMGRLEKVKGQAKTSGSQLVNTYSQDLCGQGFFHYRTDRADDGTLGSTPWYLKFAKSGSSQYDLYRQDADDGTEGIFASILNAHAAGDWTVITYVPQIDCYAHNGILRISDGELGQDNSSKWYGYIKRDIFGDGITYGGSGEKFAKPSCAEAVSEWFLTNQELVAPTAVKGSGAFDFYRTWAENEVFIYVQDEDASSWIDKDGAAEFSNSDGWAVTFIYDRTQESVLSNALTGFSLNDTDGKAIQLAMYAGSSFNHRITGVRLYWQPTVDNAGEDWYLVESFDLEDGWTESFNAGRSSGLDMGSWIKANSESEDLDDTIIAVSGSYATAGTTFDYTDTGGEYNNQLENENGDMIFVYDSTGSPSGSTICKAVETFFGTISSHAYNGDDTSTITFECALVNHLGQTWAADDPAFNVKLRAYSASSNIATTWYIPFSGYKGFTYQSRTGREQSETLPAMRWKTSCATEIGQVFVGNIDTLDDKEQTVREQSKVYWTIPGKPDMFHVLRSRDYGKDDGDEIIALRYFSGRVYVLKQRNTYVINVTTSNHYLEAHYTGYGCSYRHNCIVTPYGVVAGDGSHITLFTPTKFEELSLTVRSRLQGLTEVRPVMGYGGKQNELYYINESYNTDGLSYALVYSFNTKSWSTQEFDSSVKGVGNFQMGLDLEPNAPQYYLVDGNPYFSIYKWNDTSTDNDETAIIKTKKFNFGSPTQKKRIQFIAATYKTDDDAADAMTVKLYHDGSAIPDTTKIFSALASLANDIQEVSGDFKTLEIQVECDGQDFALENLSVRYQPMAVKNE